MEAGAYVVWAAPRVEHSEGGYIHLVKDCPTVNYFLGATDEATEFGTEEDALVAMFILVIKNPRLMGRLTIYGLGDNQ